MADTPMRADAVRNRCKILAAARRLLAVRGDSVGMDDIAADAGVAVGTLYRHFPAKADLIAATVGELTEALVGDVSAAADRVEAGADPMAELGGLLLRFTEVAATDRAIKAAASELAAETLRDMEQRGIAEVARIVHVARANGQLAPDITATDLALIVATAPGDDVPPAARHRWRELALRSITP